MSMPDLPQFDPVSDPLSLSKRWEKWRRRFESDMIEYGIVSERRQRALLYYYGGDDLEDVLSTLDNTGTRDEIKPALDALTAYFTPVEYTKSKLKSSSSTTTTTTTERMESMCRETIENNNGEDTDAEGELRGKNTYQRESCVDRNAYEREAVTNKHSNQMITSDRKSYARESITTKKSYQRKEEKGRSENKILNPHKHVRKKQKCENARNQNSHKDVEKNHTCGKIKNQDSHKDVENKCMCENAVNQKQHKHVRKKHKCENTRNQNSYKDVEKNHTCRK